MASPLVAAIRAGFRKAACTADAEAVQKYMKSEQPFYGIRSPHRREILKAALRDHPLTSEADYVAVIKELWSGRYRDEQYAALDIAETQRRFAGPQHWSLYEELLRTASWWDTADWIAARILSPVLLDAPERRKTVAGWVHDPSVWVRRAGLLVHVKHKGQTDEAALAKAIEALQDEDAVWIRKAIGWVLRSYSWTDPDWVAQFVAEHPALSALSRREALRHVDEVC